MRRLALVMLLGLSVAGLGYGCGGGGGSQPGTASPSTGTLDLSFLTSWGVPGHVTALRFAGTDANGATVYALTLAPADASVLTVPVALRTMQIDLLAGAQQVGQILFDVDLQPGGQFTFVEPGGTIPTYQALKMDVLVNADMWEAAPRMIAGGLGFTDIIGVPGLDVTQPTQSEALVRAVGGTWNLVDCTASGGTPTLDAFTSAVTPQQVATTYGVPVVGGAGLPVEFSWPIRPSTLDPTDFQIVMNDGALVTPEAASIVPNADYNERAVAVLFGQFGNRLGPDDPGARYPVRVNVVADATPLQLVGPGGQIVSAVGMGADSPGTPYTDPDVAPEDRGGPRLVGAKISRMSAVGDVAPSWMAGASPNDGIALYGEAEAQYRLRVYTSGGFSPDGVRGVWPDEYSRYFRVHATTAAGATVLLEEVGIPYDVDGATVRVVGLAELGRLTNAYDSCFVEDQDNQLDIILAGDEAAIRKITGVEVPSVAPYSPFYNPGGPGNDPTPGVRYSAPSKPHLQPVLQAIDDPMTVTFIDLRRR